MWLDAGEVTDSISWSRSSDEVGVRILRKDASSAGRRADSTFSNVPVFCPTISASMPSHSRTAASRATFFPDEMIFHRFHRLLKVLLGERLSANDITEVARDDSEARSNDS